MIVAYLLIAVFVVLDVWLGVKLVEYIYCAFIRHQPPFVAANKKMRRAVADEILANYRNIKTVCEIGSGHGNLARYIARHCKVRVFALENMPFSVFVSKLFGMFGPWRCKTVWSDAFDWLDNNKEPVDIAVAYLGPRVMLRLKAYAVKFDVLISLDFEVPGLKPVRTIDVCPGHTVYAGKKYPHRLYVYELGRR